MPRPERPLEAGDDPIRTFARDLRKLRASAGDPPYRAMAAKTAFSSTTLWEAAAGKALPSLAVARAYATSCGGDPVEWEQRWRDARATSAPSTEESSSDRVQPPYLGLKAFQQSDADRFHGRQRLLDTLRDRVRDHRLVAVLGASGSGKSSLLRAGLAGADTYPTVVLTPGAHPMARCAAGLAALAGESAEVLQAEFADPTAVHMRIRQALADRPDTDLLLVVDQFEELFTLCADEAERQAFITALAYAANSPSSQVRVVIGVRSDFFAHCAGHPELRPALGEGQLLVDAMTADELREIITKPAATMGCTVETALVARLVAEATNQPGMLPLVSHALLETWRRRRGVSLTLVGYEQAGGIHHALARTAESVYAGLDENRQVVVRQVMLRLTALGDGTEDTKRRVSRAELDDNDDVTAVLAALADARLITLDRDDVELAHEALIGHWPRLRGWLTEDRDSLHAHRQLTEATAVWESVGRDAGALYRGVRLVQARDWTDRLGPALSVREREFLTASITVDRRRTSRLRRVIAALVALLVVATGTAIFSFSQQGVIAQQRDAMTIQQVIDEIPRIVADPALTDTLTLAVYRLTPDPTTRGLVLSNMWNDATYLFDGGFQPGDFVVSAWDDGFTAFAAGFADGRVVVNRSRSGNQLPPVTVTDPTGRAADWARPRSIALSPGGSLLAISRWSGATELWNLADPSHPALVRTFSNTTRTTVTFSADGRTLAIASVREKATPSTLPTDTNNFVSSYATGLRVDLWHTTEDGPVTPQATLPDSIGPVAFSRDGGTLAARGAGVSTTDFRIWHPATLTADDIPIGNPDPLGQSDGDVTLAADGRTAGVIRPDTENHTTILTQWRSSGGKWLKTSSTLPTVRSDSRIRISRDGTTMALVDNASTVHVWHLDDRLEAHEIAYFPVAQNAQLDLDFTPDGRLILADNQRVSALTLDMTSAVSRMCRGIAAEKNSSAAPIDWAKYFPGIAVPDPCAG